jgi:histidinol-phosphate aminotransferase
VTEKASPIKPLPVAAVAGGSAYRVVRHPAPIDLRLDGNEGASPPADLFSDLNTDLARDYPTAGVLEAALAAEYGLEPDQVLVTAGADDSLDRICRAFLGPGRAAVLPTPTFEMLVRYAALTGARLDQPAWDAPAWPVEAVLAALGPETALVAVVSPNNPTGGVAQAADLQRVSAAAPQALILVDHAYIEYADEDLTQAALALPNAVVVRTFSKAWGLAGLRVGYTLGPAELIAPLRRVGNPYAASGPSLALALRRRKEGRAAMARHVAQVRAHRAELAAALTELGLDVLPSQGNFVLVRTDNASAAEKGSESGGLPRLSAAEAGPLGMLALLRNRSHAAWIRDALAGLGIGVRAWLEVPNLSNFIRISVPEGRGDLACLVAGLRTALAPQALLFDMDGVLADVSQSYRAAIRETAATFGAPIDDAAIAAVKAAGNANNDWVVTHRVLASAGIDVPFEAVKARFEALYQGTPEAPGLWTTERCLIDRTQLAAWAARWPLGIVTGRPRHDAERFLQTFELKEFFAAVVCMEDGPLKPDPAPVRLALSQLGVQHAWLVGDTPDDVRAARAAGVVPIGVRAPGDPASVDGRLLAAGAARVVAGVGALPVLEGPPPVDLE